MRVRSRQFLVVVIEMGKKNTNTEIIATLTRASSSYSLLVFSFPPNYIFTNVLSIFNFGD